MDFVKMLDYELEEFLKELVCDRKLKTGQYINIYTDRSSRNYDVFIILNEANDAPTDTEIDIIESEIRPILENDAIDTSEKRDMLEKALDDLELNCLEYGYELVFNY